MGVAEPPAGAAAEALGAHGPLAARLPGFRCREQQQAMAQRIAETLAGGGTLICEAGTGTGKTFAYLVPALLSGRKVIVSTGTRNLQDQLFQRDIPLVREALGRPLQVALLKGRSNYLCRHRLDLAVAAPERQRAEVRRDLAAVRRWAARTGHGDIAELPLPEDAAVWSAVTSTADNCLGQECPAFAACHLLEARRRAQQADLVVVNHHLLCADLALREEGFGEVLPGADAFIVDEAHQLPEVAGGFFGVSLSARALIELARDVDAECSRDAGDLPQGPIAAARLRAAVAALRDALGAEDRRGGWRELAGDAGVADAFAGLEDALRALGEALETIEGRARGLDQCLARARGMRERLHGLLGEGEGDADEGVRWFDLHGRGFRLNRTPLDVSARLREQRRQQPAAWVFTSATLAVGAAFDHFAARIGCAEAETALWASPFDYAGQSLLYCPAAMPEPAAAHYTDRVAETAAALIALSRGRAFLLFTSHRALRACAALLEAHLEYPLLVQGSAPRAELIARFRALGNAVLLGTASFWEGVDVRGEALSCVVIDRLPFASPGDPILQARSDALRRRGGNPFRELQLPQAVIALKQGAGRLIRDHADRGVLAVCDPRLFSRGYGRLFLDSLPPMPRTRELDAVRAFFADAAQRLE